MPLERTCKSNLKKLRNVKFTFSSYTQGAGDAGPHVTRTVLTAKISKLQEATRIPSVYHARIPAGIRIPCHYIPPQTIRIPSAYHARIPAIYHRIPSVYQPYTVRIPCQDPSRIPPYTVRIPAVYRIPSVYHHGPRIHYRPYMTRIPHPPAHPPPVFKVSRCYFFSFPLSSFQGLKQGQTNKRRRSMAQFKFCGAMGNVQS